MKCSGQHVLKVLRRLEDAGVPVWLDGGWGVDALLRKETREHRDMDLMIPLNQLTDAELALREDGFIRDDQITNMPSRFVMRNSEGLEVDIHPVTFNPDGSAVHIDIDEAGQQYVYVCPAAGLSGVGLIDGRVVRCTTAAEQIHQRVERRYSPWSERRARRSGVSADLEDVISLLQVFGACEAAQSKGSPVSDAVEQFCLRRVASLNAEHTQLAAWHAKLTAEHSRLTAQYAELSARHAELRAQHCQLEAQLRAMVASTSWRMTGPMRRVVDLVRVYWSRSGKK